MSFPGFFFQAEDGIRDLTVTGVQTCALPISLRLTERLERDTARLPPVARHQVLGAVDDDVGLCAKCDPRPRSEERRVGKEGRSRWSSYKQKKKRMRRVCVGTVAWMFLRVVSW